MDIKATYRKITDLPYYLAAVATVSVLMAEPAAAQERATNVGGAADGILNQVGNVGKVVVAGAFIGGLVMLGTGLMRLKQAAESQGGQVKYSEGFWRLGVGAGLIAIPELGGIGVSSLGLGNMGEGMISSGGGQTF